MLLSRWIKDEKSNSRLNIELDKTSTIDFGLRNYKNSPISFVKYIFNSNEAQYSLRTWLTSDEYERTQYIGFFKLESIRDWLNMVFSVDDKVKFVTNSFFIFNLDQVFSLSGFNINKIERNPTLDDEVIRANNALQYFKPPGYPGTNPITGLPVMLSNSGEIDIVASNMAVYGILSNGPQNLMLSEKDQNNTLEKNYSDKNVELINHVLDKMRENGFDGVYDNLLNSTQLNDHFTRELQNLYFQEFKKLLKNSSHPNYKGIKDTIKKIEQLFIGSGENIQLNDNMKYDVTIGKYETVLKILKKQYGIVVESFNIKRKGKEYINERFIGALLNIASFLNIPIHREDTIAIFNEINQIVNEHYGKIDDAKDKYIREKNRYIELKNLITDQQNKN